MFSELWSGKPAVLCKAIAMYLQKVWGIFNAYTHGTTVANVSELPLGGAGPMASMLGHK